MGPGAPITCLRREVSRTGGLDLRGQKARMMRPNLVGGTNPASPESHEGVLYLPPAPAEEMGDHSTFHSVQCPTR